MRRWLPVQIKRAVISPAVWIVSVIAVLAFMAAGSVLIRPVQPLVFGICAEEGDCAARIRDYFLSEADSLCRCRFYTDRDLMRRDVMRGKLDCAFAPERDLDTIVFEEIGDEHGIVYYQTPSTQKGLVLKEKVFACVMQAKSEQILSDMAQDRKVFPTGDESLREELLQRQKEYGSSDSLFKAVFLTADGEPADPAGSLQSGETSLRQRWIVLAVFFIFAAALMFAREKLTQGYAGISSVLRSRERAVYLLTRVAAQCMPLTVLLMVMLPVTLVGEGEPLGAGFLLRAVCSLAAGLVLAAFWSAGLSALFRSESAYLLAAVCVLALSGILTLSGAAEGVRAVEMLGHVFPMGWM